MCVPTTSMIKRVACAISGGVDSAVAALRLKQKGFEVVGVYMANWDHEEERKDVCPQIQDEIDAKKICGRLDIEFHVVNFVKSYWNDIFRRTVENYRIGRTVVPDVLCNRIIKFGHLQEYALKTLKCDALATGHYARTSLGDFLEKCNQGNAVVRLLRANDPIKDQTYFLSTLTQQQLKHVMFPIGSLIKPEVRKIAVDNGLKEVAHKPESMGMCFIGKRKNFDGFIDQYIEPCNGLIKLIDNDKVLWHHSGIQHFTIGKRVSVPPSEYRTQFGLFVASLDYETQTVWVCESTNHPVLFASEFLVEEPLWISRSPLGSAEEATVEFTAQRTHPPFSCKILHHKTGLIKVVPSYPIRAAAPGQTCVFYDDAECLGSADVCGGTFTVTLALAG